MANFTYNEAKRAQAEAEIDYGSGGATIKVALVMTNTTCDTEDDVNLLNAFTTLDEMDGSGYSRQTIGSQAVAEDAGNNRAYFDGADVTFTSLGAGTRQVAGALIYKHVGADSANIPIAYIDTGGFPFTANGGNVTIQWNASGILLFT
jgi:hypothetical protein